MELDPEHHGAFLSCEGNELMIVFDLDKNMRIASLPLAGGPDVIKLDPGLGRIYVACYSGAIFVFEQQDADQYKDPARIPAVKGARTSFYSPDLGRLYLAARRQGSSPARIQVYEASR